MPADEIDAQTPVYQLPSEDLARVQAILVKYQAMLDAPFPLNEDLSKISDEYEERLEAVDLRAQIRQEQGRLV